MSDLRFPIGFAGQRQPGGVLTGGMSGIRVATEGTGIGVLTTNDDPNAVDIDPDTGSAALVGSDVGLGAGFRRYLDSGLYNADFYQGPVLDRTGQITSDNYLPFWRLLGSATNTSITWDAASNSVTMAMGPGEAGDDVYFEQLVPQSNGSFGDGRGFVMLVDAFHQPLLDVDENCEPYIWVKGTSATGVDAGLAYTVDSTVADPWAEPRYVMVQPSDLNAYMRVRFGIRRGASTTAQSGQVTFRFVKFAPAPVMVPFSNGSSSSHAVAGISMNAFKHMFLGVHTTDGAGNLSVENPSLELSGQGSSPTIAKLNADQVNIPGGQLQFPATQVPSADVNTLDDYEEGTFTPTVDFATHGNLNVVYSQQVGRYLKIGKRVWLDIMIVTTTFTYTTASGNFVLGGLPFTAVTATNYLGGGLAFMRYTDATHTQLAGLVASATAQANVQGNGSGVGATTLTTTQVPSATNLGSTHFFMSYETDA